MRRWTIRIFVFLLLGAIINVAVAWGCVLWSGRANDPIELHGQPPIALVPDTWHKEGYRGERWGFTGYHIDVYECRTSALNVVVGCENAGWPLRSLWSVGYWPDDDAAVVAFTDTLGWRRGLPIPDTVPWSVMEDARRFPLAPIWPGFAINTVFYAAILWLLFAGPFVLRRWRRIRRGLCPKCAYDLRGTKDASACPECGSIVNVRA